MVGLISILFTQTQAWTNETWIESQLKKHFNNWTSRRYEDWSCYEKSNACEEYIQNVLGLDCMSVYGHRRDENGEIIGAHKWLIIQIGGIWKEFETTILNFQQTSKQYDDYFVYESNFK